MNIIRFVTILKPIKVEHKTTFCSVRVILAACGAERTGEAPFGPKRKRDSYGYETM